MSEFEELYNSYYKDVYYFVLKLTGYQEHITEESLHEPVTTDSLDTAMSEEDAEATIVSEELFYLNRLTQIRESVKEAFPEISIAHADQLIEEYIQANFEE